MGSFGGPLEAISERALGCGWFDQLRQLDSVPCSRCTGCQAREGFPFLWKASSKLPPIDYDIHVDGHLKNQRQDEYQGITIYEPD